MREKKGVLVRGTVIVLLCLILFISIFSPNLKLRDLKDTERYTTTVSDVNYHSDVVIRSSRYGSRYKDVYYLIFETSRGECFCRLSGNVEERKTQMAFFEQLEKSKKEVIVSKIEFGKIGFGDAKQVVDVRDDAQIYLSIEDFNNRLQNMKEIGLIIGFILLLVELFTCKPILDDYFKTHKRKKHKMVVK